MPCCCERHSGHTGLRGVTSGHDRICVCHICEPERYCLLTTVTVLPFRKMQDQLSVAHFVAGPRSQELRCSRAHCASGGVLRFLISVPCLSQSHRTSPLTSISARRRRRRGPDLARGWMASMAQGARGCGWSKHESGPHRHSLQLLCLHQVPPRATSRERVQLT